MPHAKTTSLCINGKPITLEDVARFAPVVYLQASETYFPCTIEALLSGATLHDGGETTTAPTQDDLAAATATDAYFAIDPDAYGGGGPSPSAAMYVSVQVPADKAHVDLNFYFLFGYNGAQAVRVKLGGSFLCQTLTYAEHQGDLEGVVVRVSPDFSKVLLVRFEAHGNPSYYVPSSVSFEPYPGEQHVKVYCALASHATYNAARSFDDDGAVVLASYTVAGMGADFVDVVTPSGLRWAPSEPGSKDTSNLYFVGLDGDGEAVSEQVWAKYRGRMGAARENVYERARGIGAELTAAEEALVDTLAKACEALGVIPDEYHEGRGPSGLGKRPGIPTMPAYEDAVVWGARRDFHGADSGSVAMDAEGRAVVVHKGDEATLFCTVGRVDGERLVSTWGEPAPYGEGDGNAVAMDDAGHCVEIHRKKGEDLLETTVGVVDFAGGTIAWGAGANFHGGATGAIALGPSGRCVAVHRGNGADLYSSVGAADFAKKTIAWGEPERYDRGVLNAVAMDSAGRCVEIHRRGEDDTFLVTRVGVVDFAKKTIAWGEAEDFGGGDSATIAIDDAGRCVVAHKGNADDLYVTLGVVDFAQKTIAWGRHARYDPGEANAAAMNAAGTFLEIDVRDGAIHHRPGKRFPIVP